MENEMNEHRKDKEVIQAEILGNTRISPPILEKLVHTDATPLHQIPQDNEVEGSSTVNRGHEHQRSTRCCNAREGRPRRLAGVQRGSGT